MQLPPFEKCADDSFLSICWKADEKGFFKRLRHANTRFLDRRRVLTAVDLLQKHLSPELNLPIADIACGTGNLGLLLAEQGHPVEFVDNEPRFFDYIRLKSSHLDRVRFRQGDVNDESVQLGPYSAILFGEAIEHMADPLATLKRLWALLPTGGLLCLTTPNGSFVDCTEPNWNEVKDQKERNAKLANNIGNHVCEFTPQELKGLLQEAGFGLMSHELVNSRQISHRHLLRLLPERWLWGVDRHWSKQVTAGESKSFGRIQIVVAQRFH